MQMIRILRKNWKVEMPGCVTSGWVIDQRDSTYFLVSGVPTQTSQGVANAIGYSPQPDGKFLLLKTQLPVSSSMEKLSWCPLEAFTPAD